MPQKREYDEWELSWRIEECWNAFLKQREGFFEDTSGHKPFGPPPTLTSDIRSAIKKAVLEYDSHLLGADQREAFREESKARAAGIGIFFDKWMNGTHAQNDVRNGGKRYLEPDRPWRKQRGKTSPVERYAELYWTMKAAYGRKK